MLSATAFGLGGVGLLLAGDGARWPATVARHRSGSAPPRRVRAHTGVVWPGLAAVAVVAAFVSVPAVGLAVGVVAATAVSGVQAARRRRDAVARRAVLVQAVRHLAAALDAGGRPADACAAAAELCAGHDDLMVALRAAADSARAGGAAGPALIETPGLDDVGRAWDVAAQTGAALADVLSRVAADVDAAQRRDRAVQASLAGPRAAAALLTALPVFGVVLGTGLGARPAEILIRTPGGQWLLVAGVLLDAAGVLWTRRIVAGAQPP